MRTALFVSLCSVFVFGCSGVQKTDRMTKDGRDVAFDAFGFRVTLPSDEWQVQVNPKRNPEQDDVLVMMGNQFTKARIGFIRYRTADSAAKIATEMQLAIWQRQHGAASLTETPQLVAEVMESDDGRATFVLEGDKGGAKQVGRFVVIPLAGSPDIKIVVSCVYPASVERRVLPDLRVILDSLKPL